MKNRYNISIDEDTHAKGVKNAEKIGLSFSTYVAYLILKEK